MNIFTLSLWIKHRNADASNLSVIADKGSKLKAIEGQMNTMKRSYRLGSLKLDFELGTQTPF